MCFDDAVVVAPLLLAYEGAYVVRRDEYGRRKKAKLREKVTKRLQFGNKTVTNGYKMVKIMTKWLQFG